MDKDSKVLSSIYKTIILENTEDLDSKLTEVVTKPPFNFNTHESPEVIQRQDAKIIVLATRKVLILSLIQFDEFCVGKSFSLKKYYSIDKSTNDFIHKGYVLDMPLDMSNKNQYEYIMHHAAFDITKSNSQNPDVISWLDRYFFKSIFSNYNEFEYNKVKEFKEAGIDHDDIDTILGMG